MFFILFYFSFELTSTILLLLKDFLRNKRCENISVFQMVHRNKKVVKSAVSKAQIIRSVKNARKRTVTRDFFSVSKRGMDNTATLPV